MMTHENVQLLTVEVRICRLAIGLDSLIIFQSHQTNSIIILAVIPGLEAVWAYSLEFDHNLFLSFVRLAKYSQIETLGF